MAEETELPVANPRPKFNPGLAEPGVGALKVMQFIMRKPEVFPNDYDKLWRQAHDEALAKSPYAQEMFRKIVVSKRSRVNDNDAAARAHFRMVDPPVYDMVVSFWVDSIEQVGAFRQYLDALQQTPLDFADWSESFYLYVRPVRIIDDAPPKD